MYIGDPAKGPILPCVFNKVTGLYCPGCGMTRAVHSIMHFKFYQAIRYNALVVLIPPLLIIYYLLIMFKWDSKYSKAIIYLAIAIAILYGIARNLSWFNDLMPTTVGINCFQSLMLDLHGLPHRLYSFYF
ncbi:MAG: DUF2752 domain-containing protein [Clostridiales bacterium]|nr:DUF2752 domain-containing protein [Clostridiales bacterium]